jgi:RNA polymerase sigma factor (sigma-70 family)
VTAICERGLADRLAARDHGALTELYDRFAPIVYGLAKRVSRDSHGAEDVTQEVFLKVWQRPGGFDPDRGSMRAFLGTLTHHAAVAWVRKQVASRRRERDLAPNAVGPSDDVESAAISRITGERLRSAVARLPAAQGRAIWLAYFAGLTYRQVADRTDVPEGTAKSRLRLGLRSLATTLPELD